jgi:drug/metabolite transporter (DMT)-like permease
MCCSMSDDDILPNRYASVSWSDNTLLNEPAAGPSASRLKKAATSTPQDDTATLTTSYLDRPSSSLRRPSRPSLDSTYTDLSELSFASADLHSHHRPLIHSTVYGDFHQPPKPPASFRTRMNATLKRLYVLNYGALLVMAAQFFGALMNIATRLLETDGAHGPGMHPFQILFVRQSITSLTCTVWALYTRSIPDFPLGPKSTSVRLLLLCRGVCGFMGVFGMYFSLLYLPLSEATVLTFLAPILTCYLCAWVLPGESAFSRQQQFAALVSLVGVVFIARPGSFFSSESGSGSNLDEGEDGESHHGPTAKQHLMAIAISLIGVLGATGAMTTIRSIGNRAHPFLSINYFSVFCTIMSLICLLVFKDVEFRLPGNWTEWGLLASLGACGFIMQWLLTRGLSYGSGITSSNGSEKAQKRSGEEDVELADVAGGKNTKKMTVNKYSESKEGAIKGSGTRATSMVYTQMLFALAGDKLIFGVTPGMTSWIGSGLILAGAIWVASARDKEGRGKNTEATSSSRLTEGALASTGRKGGSGEVREERVGLMSGVDDDLDDPGDTSAVESEELQHTDKSR